MLFNTQAFALFLVVTLGAWTLLARWHRLRLLLLLAASGFFYACWDWRYLFLLFGVTTFDFYVARALHRTEDPRQRRRLVTAAVVVNLGVLALWKYTNLLVDSVRPAIDALGWSQPGRLDWALPVGISFYTFQGLGYVVDVYRRELPAFGSLARFSLAKAFFPQLVAGPIVRPGDLVPQFDGPRALDTDRLGRALGQILRGLLKKAVADYLAANIVDRVFDLPQQYATAEVLAAMYGYAFQIYGDFSGYTDVAIGTATLFGFDLAPNFDHPYRATSVREFWRRWHLSLSSWLRDYLYKPLGGSRGGWWNTQRNLFLTMLLGGLWHGASWNFVVWGGFHGGALVAERVWSRWRGGEDERFQREQHASWGRQLLGWLATFHLVVVLWVFFRADSFGQALGMLRQVAAGWGGGWVNVTPEVAGLLAACFAAHFLPDDWRDRLDLRLGRSPALAQALMIGLFLYAVRGLSGAGAQPFIYFQF